MSLEFIKFKYPVNKWVYKKFIICERVQNFEFFKFFSFFYVKKVTLYCWLSQNPFEEYKSCKTYE